MKHAKWQVSARRVAVVTAWCGLLVTARLAPCAGTNTKLVLPSHVSHVPYNVSRVQNANARLLLRAAYEQWPYEVHQPCFSPDGTRLFFMDYARPGYHEEIHVLSVNNGAVQSLFTHRSQPPIRRIQSVSLSASQAFSRDNTLLAVGQDGWGVVPVNDSIELWDTRTWRRVGILKGHRHSVISLAFSSDGTRLVSGDAIGAVNIYDVPARRLIKTWTPKLPFERISAWEPTGKLGSEIITGFSAYVAFHADGSGETAIVTLIQKSYPGHPLYGALLSPPGQEPVVEIWDVKTGRQLRNFKNVKSPDYIAFSPNASLLAIATHENGQWRSKVIDWQKADVFGDHYLYGPQGPYANTSSLLFSPDSSDLLAFNFGRGDAALDVEHLLELRKNTVSEAAGQ